MNIVFCSSSDFTIPIAEAILAATGKKLSEVGGVQRHGMEAVVEVVDSAVSLIGIITQPDREHRGKLIQNPIAAWATRHNLPLFQPEKLNQSGEAFRQTFPDVDCVVVASYGQIISQELLDIPPFGMINWHPSLLPLYRGPTPMQTALANGDAVSGLTWIEMTKAMDAGDILLQETIPIGQINIKEFANLVGNLGAQTWAIALENQIKQRRGLRELSKQIGEPTFTKMLTKDMALVNPEILTAQQLYNHWRAYLMFPGTKCVDETFGLIRIDEAIPVFEILGQEISKTNRWIQTLNNGQKWTYLKTKEGVLRINTITLLDSGKNIDFSGFQF